MSGKRLPPTLQNRGVTCMESNSCMVSVYCSVYNHKKYIAQCLDSLVSQKTSFEYEIIVKDDASTDGTSDIIREYAEKYPRRVVPLILSENHLQRGLGAVAFEKAYSMTRGKYIAMCEGDDFWTDENKLQKQVDFMESHPEYSLCGHAAYYADENGGLMKDKFFRLSKGTGDLTMEEILSNWSMATCSLLYRKSCRADVIFPFQGACINSDYALMVYMALRGKVYYCDELMGAYRKGSSGSVSQKAKTDSAYLKKRRLEFAQMLDRIDAYTDGKYSDIITRQKRLVLFNLYLHLGDGKELKQYRDVYRTAGIKTKLRYILCVYCHPVYERIDRAYQSRKNT